jgi:hypothetical protein
MLRIASAKPRSAAAFIRARGTEWCADGSTWRARGADDAVTSAGPTKTVASSFKSLIPKRRARIDASTMTPSDWRRFTNYPPLRRRREEIPALAAVTPARPPTAIKRAFSPLLDGRLMPVKLS